MGETGPRAESIVSCGADIMNVLIADDDPIARKVFQHLLESWKHSVVIAKDGESALQILCEPGAPRIALLDWMMPGCSGPEICRAIRARVSGLYTYMLLVTSLEEKSDLIRGLASGADDFLTKPVDSDELQARLRVGLRILDLEDRLLKAQEVLQFAATHDSLTQLNNRASIDDSLRRELARAQRENSPMSVLLLDIDHFKLVNDTYGHAVGDEVLRELAVRFGAAVRAYDCVGRYGGEEFLILLPGCDGSTAVDQCERLLDTIRLRAFDTSAGLLQITMSIGAVCNKEIPEAKALGLLRAADTALYQAKHGGRNRAVVIGINDAETSNSSLPVLERQT